VGNHGARAHEVVSEVDIRPRNVVMLKRGTIPKTPWGKLRRPVPLTHEGA
jgi:hypothetical protein